MAKLTDVPEPLLGALPVPLKVMLDRAKFLKLMDKYYELRGWSKANGWPTRAKLEELGLKEVAYGLEAVR